MIRLSDIWGKGCWSAHPGVGLTRPVAGVPGTLRKGHGQSAGPLQTGDPAVKPPSSSDSTSPSSSPGKGESGEKEVAKSVVPVEQSRHGTWSHGAWARWKSLSRETPAAILEGTAHARQTAYSPRCSSGASGGWPSVTCLQCPPRSALTLAAPAQQPVCPGRPWTFGLLEAHLCGRHSGPDPSPTCTAAVLGHATTTSCVDQCSGLLWRSPFHPRSPTVSSCSAWSEARAPLSSKPSRAPSFPWSKDSSS